MTTECSIVGCRKSVEARGWCEMHYKRWRKYGSTDPSVLKGSEGWTDTQLANLHRVFAAFPPPGPLPSAAELERTIGRNRRSISDMATKLGLTGRRLTPQTLDDLPCGYCGKEFHPSDQGQRCCSQSCGAKLLIAEKGHPRRMKGLSHTSEAKAQISRSSSARWEGLSPEERALQIQKMRVGAARVIREPRSANIYSRTRSGKREDLGGLFVRSAWEANYARYLNWLVDLEQIRSWEYEPKTFTFPVKRGTMSYTPDFRLDQKDGSVEWHEVKGWMDPKSVTRLKRFARYYPDEVLILVDESVYRSLSRQIGSFIPYWE